MDWETGETPKDFGGLLEDYSNWNDCNAAIAALLGEASIRAA